MDNYFQTVALLGIHDGNLPVHKGMRHRRYESVEKMLDLLDVVKRIGPKFPLEAMFLDKNDPEWDDDMTYLLVDHAFYKYFFTSMGLINLFVLYNYRAFFHNKNLAYAAKSTLGVSWIFSNFMYFRYRKQVLRANLFDEYVQMRADELIKEREHLLHSDAMKKWIWFTCDLQETLGRCHRQSYKNDATDFADSELLLQDFIRRYTDETEEMPLTGQNAMIGL